MLLRLCIDAPPELLEAVSSALFDAGAGGLEEHPNRLIVYAQSDDDLSRYRQAVEALQRGLSQEQSSSVHLSREEVNEDWQRAWLEALEPERLTTTWVLRPTHRAPAPRGEKTLWFEPAQSFGAGGHPTTRLAASFLERQVKAPDTLFDVGTGTGVLSLVAAKAGASRILAVDNDPPSVEAATTNVSLNHLEKTISVRWGSADSTDDTFPWVVANINTPILHDLLPALARAVASRGHLVLTGLLEEDEADLIERARALGLLLEDSEREEGWSLLHFTRP